MESGYFKIGRFGGAPIRIHWTAPLGAIVFTRFELVPAAWGAFVLLILIHELGHALLVRRFRLALESVDVHGIGGVCRYYGTPSPLHRSLIAWGGVLGQAVFLAIAAVVSLLVPAHFNRYLNQVLDVFVWTNLWLIALNLLPIPGFDGAEAWKIFGKGGIRTWWRQRTGKEKVQSWAVVRTIEPRRRFISNDPNEDILENTPTDGKRPPPDMLN